MKLEFRTKNTYYGTGHYLCIDTNAKTFSRVPDGWVSKDVPVVALQGSDDSKNCQISLVGLIFFLLFLKIFLSLS